MILLFDQADTASERYGPQELIELQMAMNPILKFTIK